MKPLPPSGEWKRFGLFISVVSVFHWPLYQMDVKNAFLNGSLRKGIYMYPSPSLLGSTPPPCLSIMKGLSGLKHAPWAWFDCFRAVIQNFGYQQSFHDCLICTFIYPQMSSSLIVCWWYYYHWLHTSNLSVPTIWDEGPRSTSIDFWDWGCLLSWWLPFISIKYHQWYLSSCWTFWW